MQGSSPPTHLRECTHATPTDVGQTAAETGTGAKDSQTPSHDTLMLCCTWNPVENIISRSSNQRLNNNRACCWGSMFVPFSFPNQLSSGTWCPVAKSLPSKTQRHKNQSCIILLSELQYTDPVRSLKNQKLRKPRPKIIARALSKRFTDLSGLLYI